MRTTQRTLLALLSALAVQLLGCTDWKAQWAFQNIHVNETSQTQAANILPDAHKTTTVSLVYWKESDNPPAQKLLLCVLDPRGRVIGKIAADTRQEHWGVARKTVATFKADLAPAPAGQTPDGGPAYQLRFFFNKLRKKQGDFTADHGHALACAAILRILESLPDISLAPSDRQPFAATLNLIPPNGTVVVKTTDHQTYFFEYRATHSAKARVTFGQP